MTFTWVSEPNYACRLCEVKFYDLSNQGCTSYSEKDLTNIVIALGFRVASKIESAGARRPVLGISLFVVELNEPCRPHHRALQHEWLRLLPWLDFDANVNDVNTVTLSKFSRVEENSDKCCF